MYRASTSQIELQTQSLQDEIDKLQTQSLQDKIDKLQTQSLQNEIDKLQTQSLQDEIDKIQTQSLQDEIDKLQTQSLQNEIDKLQTQSLQDEIDKLQTQSLQGKIDNVHRNCSENIILVETPWIQSIWYPGPGKIYLYRNEISSKAAQKCETGFKSWEGGEITLEGGARHIRIQGRAL